MPGVYLVGDGIKVLGADAAEIGGRLAAMAALKDLVLPALHDEWQRLRAELVRMERFRLELAQAFPWPALQAAQLPNDAIVCRCEAITAGELRRVVWTMGAQEANRAKTFSRVGMGRCQGRYCGHAGAEVVAEAAGVPLEQVGRLRGQAPRVIPAFAHLNIIRVWSGIEGCMEDSRPVIGPSARVHDLYYAFGFSGHGFQLGPGVGDVMAELIHTGPTSTPIRQYHIDCFASHAMQSA